MVKYKDEINIYDLIKMSADVHIQMYILHIV